MNTESDVKMASRYTSSKANKEAEHLVIVVGLYNRVKKLSAVICILM